MGESHSTLRDSCFSGHSSTRKPRYRRNTPVRFLHCAEDCFEPGFVQAAAAAVHLQGGEPSDCSRCSAQQRSPRRAAGSSYGEPVFDAAAASNDCGKAVLLSRRWAHPAEASKQRLDWGAGCGGRTARGVTNPNRSPPSIRSRQSIRERSRSTPRRRPGRRGTFPDRFRNRLCSARSRGKQGAHCGPL